MYQIVSFSGGKDSTAMLLRLLELKEPINEVIFCDTYKEFPQMYRHIEKIKKVVEDNGITFTTLKSDVSYDFYMFEYSPKHRKPEEYRQKYGDVQGLSWAGVRCRWCTKFLKTTIIENYLKELSAQHKVIQCLGIAADEEERAKKKNNCREGVRLPLIEWGWTEADCLNYCYSLGYDWEGLYTLFNRVSCWCCPLKNLDELRNLRKHFPELWEELKDMDNRTWRKFRADYSVEELDIRFSFEEERLRENKSIRSREFFNELKELLNNGDTVKH